MKTCRSCGAEKPMDQFYRHPMMLDGHLHYCIPCVRQRVREQRIRDVEKIRARDRARGFRIYDVAKVAARNAVNHAVEHGRLTRLPCEVCGLEIVDAHHPDHSKPLEVQWLCRRHHGERHRKYAITEAT
jgi:hypothetical protein